MSRLWKQNGGVERGKNQTTRFQRPCPTVVEPPFQFYSSLYVHVRLVLLPFRMDSSDSLLVECGLDVAFQKSLTQDAIGQRRNQLDGRSLPVLGTPVSGSPRLDSELCIPPTNFII